MLFLLSFALTQLSLAVPLQLTQQGRLLDSAGASVTGTHYLHFSIHDSLIGGTQLWSETLLVNFNNGYYATVLGTDEQNNPLDSDTLSQYPVYVEIQLDSNAPMIPRQELYSVPYAQISGVSESLDGGSVNASQIWVNNIPVVDSSGAWVGPTPAVTWGDVSSKPPGFADNADNDSLGGLSCSVGEIAAWTGSAWGCASDNTVDTTSLGTMLSNNAYDLNTSTTLGGDGIVTSLTDQDSLGSLSCANDSEVAKYDIVTSSWYCAEAITESDVETYITNNAIDLNANTTKNGQILITAPPACNDGDILSYDSANNAWACIALSTVLDLDGDGVFAWNDCNDNDANVSSLGDASSCPASSCSEIINANSSAPSQAYWVTLGGSTQQVYCDMTTDGGGWTIFYSATGTNNEEAITSDTIQSGDPLTSGHHNTSRTFKMALSGISSETLFYRSNGTWIKADHAAFDSTLDSSNQDAHYTVSLTASNGVTAIGYMGWSNFYINGGGDFNLSQTDGTTCGSNTTSQGVDHHSTSYYHLNCGCNRQYLYSYSSAVADGDAGYDVNTALGDWAATASCASAEGGSLVFYAAMR